MNCEGGQYDTQGESMEEESSMEDASNELSTTEVSSAALAETRDEARGYFKVLTLFLRS